MVYLAFKLPKQKCISIKTLRGTRGEEKKKKTNYIIYRVKERSK